jgi:hypothetical protein
LLAPDEFAIDKSVPDRVGLQQQLVAGSNFQFPFLSHIEAGAACTQHGLMLPFNESGKLSWLKYPFDFQF